MYENGRGVTQDYKEAVKWWRLAAENGYASSQSNLGMMHATGKGVTQDYVKAHMWFNIAAENGDEGAKKNLQVIEKHMTSTDISKARILSTEWMETQRK